MLCFFAVPSVCVCVFVFVFISVVFLGVVLTYSDALIMGVIFVLVFVCHFFTQQGSPSGDV